MLAARANRHIELREFECSTNVVLAPAERDALQRAAPHVSVRPVPGTADCYDLTPSSRIGVVDTGMCIVTISPKIPIERVLFLISYAVDPACWEQLLADFVGSQSVVEAIAPAFCKLVAKATHRGLLHGYQGREDALNTVRGRIRFGDQIRERFGLALPIEVSYDDFTEDIEENRVLRAALRTLGALRLRSVMSGRAIKEIDAAFHAVQLVRYLPHAVPSPAITRLNEHYRPALALARLILAGSSFEHATGGVKATCFLVDMNDVFEAFVHRALREKLQLDEASFPRCDNRLVLDRAGLVRLAPDLSWWRARRCLFVGDCKYKRLVDASFKHGDLYQLLAYATAARVSGGMLIYAEGEGVQADHDIRDAGKRVSVRTLRLTGSPADVLSQIAALAKEVQSSAVRLVNQ